jgi:ABC-type sugar transport system permease subunit
MTAAELAQPRVSNLYGGIRNFLRQHWFEVVLVSPLFIYVFGTTLVPVFASILLGFENPPRGGGFPSLESYRLVLGNYEFETAFTNTVAITVLSVSLELGLGLVVAMMMTRTFRGRGLFRAIMLLPLGIPVVVAASNMRYIFLASGYLNEALMSGR